MFTTEQQAIISSTGDIRINAVAGSGKTTTIIEYAATRPAGCRILYLAFNKSVKLDAERRFNEKGLRNVKVETAHSLAYKHIVFSKGYKVCERDYKTHEIAGILGLAGTGEKHGELILANHVHRFAAYFCNSDKQRVQELNYAHLITETVAQAFVRSHYPAIEMATRVFLGKMQKGEIAVTHDFYLKMFQLSNPQLPYDLILFDEGQDASPAMLDVFLKQAATKVIVGDAHQQIYGWRHAVNSLGRVNFRSFDLSTSFRFNQDVADLAVAVLDWKGMLTEDLGPYVPVVMKGMGSGTGRKSKAILGRKNLTLLLRAINYVTETNFKKKIYFEGNINSYTYADEGASLYDVLNLYNEEKGRIRDPLIATMNDVDELEEYIENTGDLQLSMMLDIVKEYENEIPSLIQRLKTQHVADNEKDKADMIFSTVHRAKGMEYDQVELLEDFVTEQSVEKQAREKKPEFNAIQLSEEINLLYVAITRAKSMVRIPDILLPKTHRPSATIIVQVMKKDANGNMAGSPDGLKKKKPTGTTKKGAGWRGAAASTTNEPAGYLEKRRVDKNAYERWTDSADEELRQLYYKGIPIADLAKQFGRNKGAILSRLKKLGCVDFE